MLLLVEYIQNRPLENEDKIVSFYNIPGQMNDAEKEILKCNF